MSPRPEINDEAEYILLAGGEMPEVALHESLLQLEKKDIFPDPEEQKALEKAVVERYADMVRRDLDPANRTLGIFRGPERARVNIGRMNRFAEKCGIPTGEYVSGAAQMLVHYLRTEAGEIGPERRWNTLGLDREGLEAFMREVGLAGRNVESIAEAVLAVPTLGFQEAVAACRKRS